MNLSPSGDEELHIVPPDRLRPQPLENEVDQDPPLKPGIPSVDQGELGPKKGRFSFVASVLLIAIAFSVGLSYLLEKRWLSHSAAAPAAATLAPAQPEAPGEGPTGIQPLSPEMFHVTAGSPGSNSFVILNGQKMGEGESAVVSTSAGPVTVRVEKIEGSVVHLVYGSERIDVQVNPAVAQGNPP